MLSAVRIIMTQLFIGEFFFALCLNFLLASLTLCSPFIVKALIDYIQDGSTDNGLTGLMLLLLLITQQAISYIIESQIDFYQRMIGIKSTNAMIALIFRK
jgi:hypothetical protein